jgi:acyl-CoA reductase-like NAD-dependent aldehyde dehydrogenase
LTTDTPLIGGQMITDGDVRDAHDPGRLADVVVNTHSFESLDLRMPFGGVKQSGIGREFGEAGLSEYAGEHAIRRLK